MVFSRLGSVSVVARMVYQLSCGVANHALITKMEWETLLCVDLSNDDDDDPLC